MTIDFRVEPLEPHHLLLDLAPAEIRKDLLQSIAYAIGNHPRSLQKAIGPSELGTVCTRKLGYKLAGTSPVNIGTPWRPTVGTAVHAWLADVFEVANHESRKIGAVQRWAVEHRVCVGEVDGNEVWGSSDLYDRVTGTVIDWKVVGPTTLKKMRTKAPSEVYQSQLQCYGRGFARQGLPVQRVAIMFMPACGDFKDVQWWSTPYDEDVALAAIRRVDALACAIRIAGAERIIPGLPAVEDYCQGCDYYRPGPGDETRQCPGPGRSNDAYNLGMPTRPNPLHILMRDDESERL